jgi:O-antigen ligase
MTSACHHLRCRENFAVAFRNASGIIGLGDLQTRLAVKTTTWHTMVALRVVPINVNSGLDNPAVTAHRHTPRVVAVCLFLLLVFSTATVFVRDAWALQSFQIGVFALLAVYLVAGIGRGQEHIAGGLAPWLVYLIPLWGLIQILAHTTASSVETREAVLRWGALAGVFFLTQTVAQTRTARRNILSVFLIFATGMAVLCLTQLFTSEGKVLWIFPTGYPDVYATFPYYNNYAQFVELALPIALWRALREGWRSWWYALAGGLLYASVIGSASRAGSALCTAELLTMLAIGLVRLRDPETGLPTRSTTAILVIVPVLAAAFTLAVGWERVWLRFQQNDPYLVRREFIVAAADMARQRPLTGYGLGTFPEVYQRYAIKDFPFYANHAHNDWAEFAADGGVPFLLLVLIPFAACVPAAVRNPWGLGLIAVMLHACVDYPFPRPAVSGWMFLMLALLFMARMSEETSQRKAKPVISDEASSQGVA